MFEGFANVWTPVTLARRLKANKPLPVVLAGEKLVFFRGRDGVAGALIDRCPHRGVALSLGTVKDGCLECPFHAWQFDPSGACTTVPLNPDAKRDRLFAMSLPTRELGGILWVYTAPVKEAPHEPVVPGTLTRTDLSRTYLELEWNAHWSRAMENMLDSPHVPFLHQRTIGRFVRPYLKPDSRMEIGWEPTDFGAKLTSVIDGDSRRDAGFLEFYRPNMMVLTIPVPKQTFRMHSLCIPAEPNRVRMLIVGSRSFATLPLLNPFFNWSNRRIAEEDRAVVESSFPVEVPPPAEERSVRTDRATLQFRKYYYDVLKPSVATEPARALLSAVAAND